MLRDITRPIHAAMAIYPGNPPVEMRLVRPADAASSALSVISLGSHTGTHIDAPAHIRAGAAGTASYSLDVFVGRAQVLDLGNVPSVITAVDLPDGLPERVVIKTINSKRQINDFNPDFVALDESAALRLVASGVKLIGTDGPSIKKKGIKDKVHQILLEAGIVIVEGLWLAGIDGGHYELICLPLAIDCDGAPVRALLRQP